MNKLKSLQVTIIAVGVLLLALTATARPWPQSNSDLPVDPTVEWGRLDNGIRYVIMPWSEPPERVSMRLVVEAGWLHEEEDQKGLAHLIEHMAFNGSKHYSAGEMVEYFQRLGMSFGADTNAHTWWRETVYKLELPKNEESLLRDGFQLLRDYADGLLMHEEEVQREKGVVLSEYRDGDSAPMQASIDGLKFALPDSLLSKRIARDEDVLRMATREDLWQFYQKWYTADRLILVIVGEVDPASIEGYLEEYFASMPGVEESVPDLERGTINPVQRKTNIFSHEELPNGNIGIYTRRKVEPETDSMALRLAQTRLDLANAILSRRFEKLSKEEGAIFTGASGYDYRLLDFVRFTGVSIDFEVAHWRKAMEVATTELNRALEFGFSESELAEAKANTINAYEELAARSSTRKSRELSSALVRSVVDNEVMVDPAALRDLMVPDIEAMTVGEVWAAFKEAWMQEERMINMQGNFESLLEEEFVDALAIEVEAPEVEEEDPWAYSDSGDAGTVVESTHVEDLDIFQYVLSNGVRVNLKQTDFEANKILVKASFGTGKLTYPKDQPGLSLLAQSTFIDGGLGAHSKDAIDKLMAGKTVGVEFSIGDNEFTLGGVTNSEDLRTQLELMAAYLTDPGYRPESKRLFDRQLDGLYTQLTHEPIAIIQNEVVRFLAGGDNRFGFPSREDLDERTLEEVQAWLSEPLGKAYLEISLVGDFTSSESVMDSILATFGALDDRETDRPELVESRKVSFPRGSSGLVIPYPSNLDRAMVLVSWPTSDQSDIFRSRRLSALANIYTDRLRIEVREKIGEAYSPYSYNNSSDTYTDYGIFLALAGVDPASVDLVQEIFIGIGDSLATEGIAEDELVRAIEPLKNSIKEYRRSNAYWLNSVMLRSQYEPHRFDWARTFADFWDTITVEQINALATEYLTPDEAVPIQIIPRS